MMESPQDGENIWTGFAGNSRCVPSSARLKEYIADRTPTTRDQHGLPGG